jgi:hypothetical protein
MEAKSMSKVVRSFTVGILSIAAAAFTTALPTSAEAQDTCNTFLAISIGPAGPVVPGGTKKITFSLGTDGIQNGTKVTISNVRYDLDCNGDLALGLPCTDQGDIFNYQGDATITSTCGACMAGNLNAGAACAPIGPGGGCDATTPGDNAGTCVPVTWTSNVPAGGNATNEIVFSPSPLLDIPATMFPYCDLSFDVKLDNLEPTMGPTSDSSPTDVEIVAGVVGSDAVCDNALPSEGSQSASVTTAPGSCGDGVVQPGETCDPPGSTPSTPAGNMNVCRSDCTYCGDAIVNGGETCDTGGVPNVRCQLNCTGRLNRDPGIIRFHAAGRTGLDRLWVHGAIFPTDPIDPTTVVLGVRLSNASGVIYSSALPALAVKALGRKFQFSNKNAVKSPSGGIASFIMMPSYGTSGYRTWVVAYGDLSAATTPDMTIEVFLGQAQYTERGPWNKTKTGWTRIDRTVWH